MEINSRELVEKSGATYRQIDYWCRSEVICPLGEATPGSGGRRVFDDSIVNAVTLLVRVSNAFGGAIGGGRLKHIYDSYENGSVDLGNDITLIWRL